VGGPCRHAPARGGQGAPAALCPRESAEEDRSKEGDEPSGEHDDCEYGDDSVAIHGRGLLQRTRQPLPPAPVWSRAKEAVMIEHEVPPLASIQDAEARLRAAGYLPSAEIATSAFLADGLAKPVLVEGPAGVGKTEFARALATATGRVLIRMQCYEGLDEAKALYEWEYAKQLLYTQLLKDKLGETLAGATSLAQAADRIAGSEAIFFSDRFLLPRPLLAAIRSPRPALLLVDEVDKADPEFEAFLLEVLSDFAVTVPEIGTIRAVHTPRVVLTSNAARELSDALKRRCLHLYIDFPTPQRELEIVRSRVPGVQEALARKVVAAVQAIRKLDLKKSPSISETLDWVRALALLNAATLDGQLVSETLSIVLKYEADVAKAKDHLGYIASAELPASVQ
jgi:MoxR-like ATPase